MAVASTMIIDPRIYYQGATNISISQRLLGSQQYRNIQENPQDGEWLHLASNMAPDSRTDYLVASNMVIDRQIYCHGAGDISVDPCLLGKPQATTLGGRTKSYMRKH